MRTYKSYEELIGSFLSDSRWCNGTSWGPNDKSKMGGKGWAQCAAYAYDFAKYVFNRDPNSNPVSTQVTKTQNMQHQPFLEVRLYDHP